MKIYSVIACYYPEIENLVRLCSTLTDSGSEIIIVDNSEESSLSGCDAFSHICVVPMGENTGVARAQNFGIKLARKKGADIIVFFDQDSKISPDFLPSLLAHLKSGEPGVVAPVFFDDAHGYEFPSFILNGFGLPEKTYRKGRKTPYEVDIITSSGTAATAATFDIAGLMDETLFIDHVDTEWSLRCRNMRVPILIVPDAVMHHSIGKRSTKVGKFTIFLHDPDRSYYQIRNSILLFRKEWIPFPLALKEFISTMFHQIISLFFVQNRILYMKSYFLGINHGVRGITGKKPA